MKMMRGRPGPAERGYGCAHPSECGKGKLLPFKSAVSRLKEPSLNESQ